MRTERARRLWTVSRVPLAAFGAALSALAVQAGCSTGGEFPGTGYATGDVPSGGDDGGCGYGGCPDPGVTVTLGSGSSSGGFVGSGPQTPNQPSFGPTTVASRPPPAISGGTLLVTKDGSRAVASDPDRDVVYVVDLPTGTLASTIALQRGDEPGRLVEDGAGHVHVALREGGALLTIDPVAGKVLLRRDACPAPRGVAYDASGDQVWVACATGELVALPAGSGAVSQALVVERDLRDVVVANGTIAVSQFRSAQLLTLDATGSVSRRDQLPSPVAGFSPHVAWRTIAGPSGTFVAVHQAETTSSLQTHVTGGYGGGGCGFGGGPPPPPPPPLAMGVTVGLVDGAIPNGTSSSGTAGPTLDACNATPDAGLGAGSAPGCLGPESGAVASVLSVLGSDGTTLVNRTFQGVLPVDVAVSPDGTTVAAVAPGNAFLSNTLHTVLWFSQCAGSLAGINVSGQNGGKSSVQPIAVAFAGAGKLLVQTREPAGLTFIDIATGTVTSTALSSTTREDTGHDVFHTQAGGLIACASCHPEGRDDGHVWTLDGARRRTPSLRGTIAGTAPYHWPGDETNLNVLVNDVYTVRMSGQNLTAPVMSALTGWVQAVPRLAAPSWVDPAAAARGETLFNDATVGCSGCHAGEKFTNNTTVDVGTGGKFQVPPLVGVGWRTPLFHDGCATTLADRFGKCSTSQHGNISGLSTGDVSDLIAYLETL